MGNKGKSDGAEPGVWALGRIWLRFPEGHPMHGFEVLMRRRRMREQPLTFAWRSDEQLTAMTPDEKAEYVEALSEFRCREFARFVIKWNLVEPVYDDEGNEAGQERIPPTPEGVGRLDPDTFTALWDAYNEATSLVAPPLQQRSDDGEPSEVESTLPQESLSDSPRTLSTL